jgi:hypothetical protein
LFIAILFVNAWVFENARPEGCRAAVVSVFQGESIEGILRSNNKKPSLIYN